MNTALVHWNLMISSASRWDGNVAAFRWGWRHMEQKSSSQELISWLYHRLFWYWDVGTLGMFFWAWKSKTIATEGLEIRRNAQVRLLIRLVFSYGFMVSLRGLKTQPIWDLVMELRISEGKSWKPKFIPCKYWSVTADLLSRLHMPSSHSPISLIFSNTNCSKELSKYIVFISSPPNLLSTYTAQASDFTSWFSR